MFEHQVLAAFSYCDIVSGLSTKEACLEGSNSDTFIKPTLPQMMSSALAVNPLSGSVPSQRTQNLSIGESLRDEGTAL